MSSRSSKREKNSGRELQKREKIGLGIGEIKYLPSSEMRRYIGASKADTLPISLRYQNHSNEDAPTHERESDFREQRTR